MTTERDADAAWTRLGDELVTHTGSGGAVLDVERLADVLHAKVCGPFATIDPRQCVAGRARDVRLAEAIAEAYGRALLADVPDEPVHGNGNEEWADGHPLAGGSDETAKRPTELDDNVQTFLDQRSEPCSTCGSPLSHKRHGPSRGDHAFTHAASSTGAGESQWPEYGSEIPRDENGGPVW